MHLSIQEFLKEIIMKPRVIFTVVFFALGLIIAAVPQSRTMQLRVGADDLLEDLHGKSQFISPDEVAAFLVEDNPVIRLIDIRSPEEFQAFHLPGAVNLPMTDLLNSDYRYLIDQDLLLNVFYSNGSVKANEAWMITRQLGYRNNYVLEGGLNYWAEVIMNPERPASTSPDDEIARYNFRMGASKALGGDAGAETAPADVAAPLPAITKRPAKQRASGGC